MVFSLIYNSILNILKKYSRCLSILTESMSKLKSLIHFLLFATPWTIQSLEFSRPEYWSGWPFPSPGDLPNPGIGSPTRRPGSQPGSPALQVDSFLAELPGNPTEGYLNLNYLNKHKVQFLRCNNQTLRVQKHK